MKKIEEQWYKEEKMFFEGWDFSYLENRWKSEPLSWSYEEIVKEYLTADKKLLDIGTGGGEFLLSLNHPYENTAATESWQPNIELCQKNLVPLGIDFCPTKSGEKINLRSNSFDIIVDRHAEYDEKEIKRLLKPGGVFITQQVGSRNCSDLAERLNKNPQKVELFSLQTEMQKFEKENFFVKRIAEEYPWLTFTDVGAIVYFAKRIVWTFPDFSVENNCEQLKKLQVQLNKDKEIKTVQHRFLLIAQKKE